MKILSIFIVVLGLNLSYGQSIEPKYTFNVELGLPVSMANKPFDDIMQGLVNASVYGQYSFPFHLNVGFGANYSLFTIDEFSVPSPVFGALHSTMGFAKLGWDKYHNDRVATDFHVKMGYGLNIADTWWEQSVNGVDERVNHLLQFESYLIEPSFSLILAANENTAFSWRIGYGIQGYRFTPGTIGLQSDEGYESDEMKNVTQYLVVGFGYIHYFNGKKN